MARGESARHWPALLAAALLSLQGAAMAQDAARVQSVVHAAPGGLEERCVMLARMPDGRYRDADDDAERMLCEIDFYAGAYALCPQVSGSQPVTLIYGLTGGPYAQRMADFEREVCPRVSTADSEALAGVTTLRMAVQTREMPATAANAAILYYHFARYFEAEFRVPPAVMRSMDKEQHLQRVARRGEATAANRSSPTRAGWAALVSAERDPSRYAPVDELFSADRKQVYGVLLRPEGWPSRGGTTGLLGPGHDDFQRTMPFVALSTDQPLASAIRQTLGSGSSEAAPPPDVSELQLALWMRELIDITLLDALLGPQGRIGEIDQLAHWAWVERGLLVQRRATGPRRPDDIAQFQPRLVRRSGLGVIDAGPRNGDAASSQRQSVLERLRHYDVQTYRKLLELAGDFEQRGALYRHVRSSYGLGAAEFERLAGNIRQTAAVLQASCRAGKLRFDLDPEAVAGGEAPVEAKVDCRNP